MTRPASLVVLTGNGLSIAANPELALPQLSAKLLRAHPGLAQLVDAHADGASLGDDTSEDFELIVDLLESAGGGVRWLAAAASTAQPAIRQTAREAQATVDRLVQQLYFACCATVLHDIVELTKVELSPALEGFASWLADMHVVHGSTALYTLNYDVLLERLVELRLGLKRTTTDLFSGRRPCTLEPFDDGGRLEGWVFDPSDPPRYPVRLHHLHGCLAHVEDLSSGRIVKLRASDVREARLFERLVGVDDPPLRPSVILGTRGKSERARERPFNYAFDALARDATSVRTLVIVGYSFRDEAVNERLKAAALRAQRLIVIDHRRGPTARGAFLAKLHEHLGRIDVELYTNGVTGDIPLDAPGAARAA